MLAVQAVVLKLLKEIDEICSAEGINYSLAGRTAAMQAQSGGWVGSDYCAEIMMTAENYRKFEKAIKDHENRSLESLKNNYRLDGIYARYTDLNTTLINFTNGANVRDKGICVKIFILRSKPLSSKTAKIREMIVKNSSLNPSVRKKYCGKKEFVKMTELEMARSLLGGRNAISKFFNACIEDDGSSKYYFYYDGTRKCSIARKLLKDYRKVEFEGVELSVVEKSDEMLKKIYSDGIAKELVLNKYPATDWGVYYDVENSFADVEKEANSRDIDFDRLAQEKCDYDEFSAKIFARSQNAADRQFRYVWRTINRFRLLEEYSDKEEDIKKAYKEGSIDDVREDLADYIEMIENYEKKGMGFSYDQELYNIACEIMIKDGKEDVVKKAQKLMPEEYKINLIDYLKKEGFSGAISPEGIEQ